ncbi:uncharacterized protein [Aristolochia californica]|uniref:uncharacterized protein n=1 Tax=Aristolochia californica TaxID=171875 RepID=UPI0035DACA9B
MSAMEAHSRAGDVRIWIVTVAFLGCILTGGAFLVIYISLPETPEIAWYPVLGMVFVGIPWLFWLVTFLYRVVLKRRLVRESGAPWYPNAAAASATAAHDNNRATNDVDEECAPESRTGGEAAMDGVMVEGKEGQGSGERGESPEERKPGNSTMTASEDSSLASRECEVPLAFAMSS